MPRVLLTTCSPQWPFARQTPGSLGKWENFEFILDQQDETVDAWVAFDNPTEPVRAKCNPDNTFFITAEPPELRSYNPWFLKQFRWVITCHDIKHRGHIRAQQCQPWHVGVGIDAQEFRTNLDYDALSNMPMPEKTRLISAAISNKAITEAHRQRLDFVYRLKAVLGDQLSLLGVGCQPFVDKWDAVAPYRFHLALENAVRPHYITEKLGDAFLGYAFPFYFGAPNIGDHYPDGSYAPIDLSRPEAAIQQICQAIDDNLDMQRREQVAQARHAVLNQWNMFPRLVRVLREKMTTGKPRSLCIYRKSQRLQLAMSNVNRAFSRAA